MSKQLEINLYSGKRGGRRPNSGRVRIHSKGVSHRKREKVTSRNPLHINFKFEAYLRNKDFTGIFDLAIQNASEFEFSISCYSIQSNHIHLIAEAKNNETLYKGMRSITNTIVKRLRKGSIQIERYHLHVLKSPTEVRHALFYILNNDLKHTGKMDKRYTKIISPGRSWLLTSSLIDIASEVSPKFLYP